MERRAGDAIGVGSRCRFWSGNHRWKQLKAPKLHGSEIGTWDLGLMEGLRLEGSKMDEIWRREGGLHHTPNTTQILSSHVAAVRSSRLLYAIQV